jgi:tryptophan synthase beta chain
VVEVYTMVAVAVDTDLATTEPGWFGPYGGRFVPETIVPALTELEAAFAAALRDESFLNEYQALLRTFVGRPTPLYEATRLSAALGTARIFLKREDLAHTGAHKINSALGQGLLARRMGKQRIIAETGAGQHGVATATVCAMLGLRCVVYMGEKDMQRQSLNVFRMRLLGAEVRPVTAGSRTLKDATTETFRDWVTNVATTAYINGSVVGPHPYPTMVREFQSVIGREARAQMLERTGTLPQAVLACVGGGSNAMGIFHPFVADREVQLHGAEAAGHGLGSGMSAASLVGGRPGVLHGAHSYVLQTDTGQIVEAHSSAAGLDYPGVGPEHAYFKDIGRARYHGITDDEALEALQLLCRLEGIIPALESAHAVALAAKLAPHFGTGTILINLSGRGDKDMVTIASALGLSL